MSDIALNPICKRCGRTLFLHTNGKVEHGSGIIPCGSDDKIYELVNKDESNFRFDLNKAIDRYRSIEINEVTNAI